MNAYQQLLRPQLFRQDPEACHDAAIRTCSVLGRSAAIRSLTEALYGYRDPRLQIAVANLTFPNPIGLAAGFDKSGRAVRLLSSMGFGHLEIGSVSADVSHGNPKPRLFRLPEDEAIIVHYGLPNDGAEAVAKRLDGIRLQIPLGINIVKTNRGLDAPSDSDDAVIDDYFRSVNLLKSSADYLMLNLSCPNTENGRNFFAESCNTRRLLTQLKSLEITCPVFLKVSPIGGTAAIETLLSIVEGIDYISGFAFNLTAMRPDGLKTDRSLWEKLPGAIAGKPVEAAMNVAIRDMYRRMDRERYKIIGIGGVSDAESAYRKIRLGASLVQLYTGLVYQGPGIIRSINKGLRALLERDGIGQVSDAIGLDADV